MDLSPNQERLELERQTANESLAAYYQRYSKPTPPNLYLEPLSLEPETAEEAEWFERHFHRPVTGVLAENGGV